MRITRLHTTSDTAVKVAVALALIVSAVLLRLAPHPANVAPIAAIAIFGGALLPRRWGVFLPLAAMIASDLVIGLHGLVLYTWGSFALIALASHYWVRRAQPATVLAASFAASTFFYLVTNFGVWLQGNMYAHTWQGLVQCYYMALPFFRNTLLGDLLYTTLLFGLYALAVKVVWPRVFAARARAQQ